MKNDFSNYWDIRAKKDDSITTKNYLKYYLFILKKFPSINKKFAHILNLKKNSKVLDVGCGTGAFLRVVSRLRPDLELYGVDIDDSGFKHIDFNVKLKIASGDKLPFKDNFFDYVACQHVLEHVLNPEVFFRDFVRVSKKYVMLVTPNHTNIWLFGNQNFYIDFTHYRPFTKASFRLLSGMNKQNKIIHLSNERYINLPWLILVLLFPLYLVRKSLGDWFANVCFKRGVIMIVKKTN